MPRPVRPTRQRPVDRAARRLLLQKVELGLLDEDWTPEGSVRASVELDSAENRAIAAELAEKSVVLLDAGTALPLTDLAKVAVIGQNRPRLYWSIAATQWLGAIPIPV